MSQFFVKIKRLIPLISILLIIPGFSEEMKPLCEKATKAADDKEKLVALKKQLIEKEKELVRRNRVLVEKEKELLKKEKELQHHLNAQNEQPRDELQAALPLNELFDENQLYAQADDQDDKDSLQPELSPVPPPVEKKTPQPAPKVANDKSEKCRSPFQTMHVGVRHTEARGVGYKHGYTTLEGFGIYDAHTSLMPFVDLRAHVFDNGDFAGNVGIGARSYLSSIDYVLGAYLYYDIRQRTHRLLPQQLSPGIELLGDRFEYRMNGYFPVGSDESRTHGFKFVEFDEHSIIVKGKQHRTMTGGDAEIGAHLTQSTKYDIYAGVGPYYFTASDRSAWGGKARLLGRFKQYVSLEASYSYDHLFKNIVQGTIALNLPLGNKIRRKGKNCSTQVNLALGRADFAPYRFEIPVVKKFMKKEKAVNPASGEPWKVWFVDNTSSSSGTFESPFPTLVQAQNASSKYNMIYVFPGDGTTTGMNTGITLKNGQKFLGAGLSHKINTTHGKITIPAYASRTPNITNRGSIVTLASGNEVSGFNLIVTTNGSNAIDGTKGIQWANINHNSIFGSAISYTGVNLAGGGHFSVNKNVVLGLINPGEANFPNGILIQNFDQDDIDIDVSKNFVSGFFRGINVTPFPNPTSSMGTVDIHHNFVRSFEQFGIEYSTGMVDSTMRIRDNTILNDTGGAACRSIAVILNQQPNTGTMYVTNNNITDTTTAAASTSILAQINNSRVDFSRMILSDNTMLVGPVPGSFGILMNDLPENTICASFIGNIATLQTPGTTSGLTVMGGGVINIVEFEDNVFPNQVFTGNVNFVESCESP